jgi:photosystem II stability/assembly factor-like uncharacterized protein
MATENRLRRSVEVRSSMSTPLRFPWFLLAASAVVYVAAYRSALLDPGGPAATALYQWRPLHTATAKRGQFKNGVPLLGVGASGLTVLAPGPAATFRSTDGGTTWAELPKFSGTHAAFGTQGLAFISSTQGKIHRSTDGGITWVTIGTPAKARLMNIALFTNDDAIASGDSALLSSFDRGLTWTKIPVPAITLFGLAVRAKTAIAVGGAGFVTRSTDGGVTWTQQWLPVNQLLVDVEFADDTTVLAAGTNGLIMRSTDAGAHWHRVKSPTRRHIRDIAFLDTRHGMAVGLWGEALVTNDAGITWTRERTGTDSHLFGVSATGEGDYIVAGIPETILRAGPRR